MRTCRRQYTAKEWPVPYVAFLVIASCLFLVADVIWESRAALAPVVRSVTGDQYYHVSNTWHWDDRHEKVVK
jgi:hypothetical protein